MGGDLITKGQKPLSNPGFWGEPDTISMIYTMR